LKGMPMANKVNRKRKLTDIRVGSIAFVDRGANRRPFFLFKRDAENNGVPGDNDMADRPITGLVAVVEKAASIQDVLKKCVEILKGQPDDTELAQVCDVIEKAMKDFPPPAAPKDPAIAEDGSYPYPFPASKSENGKHILDVEKVLAEVEKRSTVLKEHNKAVLTGALKAIKAALENKDEEALSGDAALAKAALVFTKAATDNDAEINAILQGK